MHTMHKRHYLRSLISLCLALATPLLHADPIAGPGNRPPAIGQEHRPDGAGPRHGGPFEMGIPPYLRNVELSEAQRDRLFEMMYAELPNIRQQIKSRFKTMQELQGLARADRFDETKAQQLAGKLATIEKDMALSRVRNDAKIFAMLTPEQRRKLQDQAKPWQQGDQEQPVDFKQRPPAPNSVKF